MLRVYIAPGATLEEGDPKNLEHSQLHPAWQHTEVKACLSQVGLLHHKALLSALTPGK